MKPSSTDAIPLRMLRPPSWIKLLMLGTASSLFGLADGCLRRSSSNSQSSNNQRPPMPERSTVAPSHKLPCVEWEINRTACLNGGSCFVLQGPYGARNTACQCPADFVGSRCQEIFIDPSILQSSQQKIRTAHVTAAVSVCVLVFFVVLLMIYVYIKYRRKSNIPVDQIRGPKLEIREYYNNNSNPRVPWLSFKKKPEPNQMPLSAVDENDMKLPVSNGRDEAVDPLLTQPVPPITSSHNEGLGRSPPENNGGLGKRPMENNNRGVGRQPSENNNGATNMVPSVAYCPADFDTIRFIEEPSTLQRPKKHKAKQAESQS